MFCFYYFYNCVYCVGVCASECRCSWRPEIWDPPRAASHPVWVKGLKLGSLVLLAAEPSLELLGSYF